MTYTLVTGATSDIGRQICLSLEGSGHHLLLTDLMVDSLEDTLRGMQHPEQHYILPLDFSDVENAKTELQSFLISNQMQVSHAVFAAGVFSIKPLRVVDYSFVKKNFDIALFSIIAIMQLLSSKKVNANSLKSVVMISSVSAVLGTKGYGIYGSVKAAMLGLMKSLAAELAPQTRVNAVLPGGIRTKTTSFLFDSQDGSNPRYLLGDGTPTDIANMVDFLLSDKARWISGQGFVVDGGLTCN